MEMPVLAQIPYRREIAEAYARGQVIAEAVPSARSLFVSLAERITDLAARPMSREEACHA
jgi:hypothetical protein